MLGATVKPVRGGIESKLTILSRSTFQTLAPGRERNEVRTFFEEDIEIPIYEIPPPQKVRTP